MYADVIWLLNWLFDTMLLAGTAILLKRNYSLIRAAAGGFIGSIIIVLNFSPLYAWAEYPLIKLLFSVLMILAVFGFKRWKYFIKGLLALYLITFLVGGMMIGVHFFFQSNWTSVETKAAYLMKGYGDPVSWLFVIIGFPIAWLFSKKNLESLEMTKIKYDQLVKLKVKLGSFEAEALGLVDSGNQLYDPLTGAPIMFLSIKGMEEHLPPIIFELLAHPEDIMEIAEDPDFPWRDRLRLIPSKVIGVDQQLLPAFKPDSVRIFMDGKPAPISKCLVSFTLQQLSPDSEYQAILHPKMIAAAAGKSAS
ncbi:sigma-E processing peptidase SpoIIGA [Peribacillus kribbensis]|uniref:sigma-E processing peptidase SpoIIGA n=1 Tax=Peribacillus kribbensis TaxID=356658 RepID=UPI001FE1C9D2|nr:sigma-E processing peptidase SpoIIGA [Peribacillus kribbensis]